MRTQSFAWRSVLAACAVAACLAVAACGDDDDGTTASVAQGATAASSTASEPAAAAEATWAVDYAGGTAGKAGTGAPVKVGYINQEDATPSYEGASVAFTSILDYMNANAGGADGHPLTLSKCVVQTEEDGQKCAAQFLSEDVSLVLVGQLVVGSDAFYKTLRGKIPVINSNPGNPSDLTSPNVFGMSAGALQLNAVGTFIADNLKPASVAVVYQSDPVGTFIAQKLLKPQLVKAGITKLELVAVPPTATTPDVVSSLQASNAANADVIAGIISGPACQSLPLAYKQLSLKAQVVTEGDCYGKQTTEAVGGQWPDGWYFISNLAYDAHLPDAASGMDTFLAAMNATEEGALWVYDPHAAYAFPAAMLTYKLLNQEGADATAQQLSAALKAYDGPVALSPEPFQCGDVKTAPNVCTYRVSFVESRGGKWLPAATGEDAIDARG